MLRDWLILIWCKVQFTIDEEVSNSVYFFLIFKLKNLCNMVCLNQDPVNFKALTDNSRHCLESLSVVLHVYAEDECQSLWHNSNVSEREITLIANDSLNIIFCTHILTSELHTKSGICAICKINCNAKNTKSCHILIYQRKLIWTELFHLIYLKSTSELLIHVPLTSTSIIQFQFLY